MNILLGVTGSISAYKALDLISSSVKRGDVVKVIMTESAKMFVTEMSLAVMSKNPVVTGFGGEPHIVEHVALAEWADIMIIAPASANTISKMCSCQLDNPLLCAYSVFVGKHGYHNVFVAPAMNNNMWLMMKDLVETLKHKYINIIPPQKGVLACGDVGIGKLATVVDILAEVYVQIDMRGAV